MIVKANMKMREKKKHSVRFDPEDEMSKGVLTGLYLMNDAFIELECPEKIVVHVEKREEKEG